MTGQIPGQKQKGQKGAWQNPIKKLRGEFGQTSGPDDSSGAGGRAGAKGGAKAGKKAWDQK